MTYFAISGEFIDAIDHVEEDFMEETDMLIRSWGGDDEHDYMAEIAENTLVIRKLQALSFHARRALDHKKRTLEYDGLDWYMNWDLLKSNDDRYYIQDHIVPEGPWLLSHNNPSIHQPMMNVKGGQQ